MKKLVLLVLATAIAPLACRTPPSEVVPEKAAPAPDAGVPSDAAAPRALLPYPAGPYGFAQGEVLPDFDVLGYALSRTERDIRRLPFRRITASEVRSDGACTCMLVLWDVSGFTCPWSTLEGQTVMAGLDADPTICAIEVLDGNFDTLLPDQPGVMAPTTRADLDAFTLSARQNYPVGIVTTSTRETLSGRSLYSFPVSFVVDPKTMRLVDVHPGMSPTFLSDAKKSCASGGVHLETLATGLAPRQVLLAGDQVIVLDASGIFRMPAAGGARTPIAGPTRPPTSIANAGASLLWIAGGELGIVDLDGASPRVLATAPDGASWSAMIADDVDVYGTRTDGVVASVPLAGGAVRILATNEAQPSSIALWDHDVVFLASGTGEMIHLAGASRSVLPWTAPPSMGADARVVGVYPWPPTGFAYALGSQLGTTVMRMPGAGMGGGNNLFGVSGLTTVVLEKDRFVGSTKAPGAHTIVFDDPEQGAPSAPIPRMTPGQPDVPSVAADASYVYWVTAESAPGAKDGALRRRRR